MAGLTARIPARFGRGCPTANRNFPVPEPAPGESHRDEMSLPFETRLSAGPFDGPLGSFIVRGPPDSGWQQQPTRGGPISEILAYP